MADLFNSTATKTDYSAKDIEVLEGLEPVRRRPGMYIGGTDERAMHHMVAELIDNSMDEVVAGHAKRIEVELLEDYSVRISDNGRGIPVDPHPKYPKKSALEIILTTLHSGGKFGSDAYETSGGLHGVGLSVVNALADNLVVEVVRSKVLWRQSYSQGAPQTKLVQEAAPSRAQGTTIIFHPDAEIFGADQHFKPATLYKLARAKAYLIQGVEILWKCAPSLLPEGSETPAEDRLCFQNGVRDFLSSLTDEERLMIPDVFFGRTNLVDGSGHVEWAISWTEKCDNFLHSFCNTVPTPQGGTHENGFRYGVSRALKAYGEMVGNKKATQLTAEDCLGESQGIVSAFIKEPQFQGQTKEKLVSQPVTKAVETVIKDHFDHWLGDHKDYAQLLLDHAMERMDDRLRRKQARETARKTPTRRLRLPGKLADCTSNVTEITELFIVEGDSAGGTAKPARNRLTQAILPLRGKILNVASATRDKLDNNMELQDLSKALGCGMGKDFDISNVRYGKVIIMTDADVDGAHIASLLMTFFYQQMRPLVEQGRLYLAQPPLYRLVHGSKSVYARDDADKDRLIEKVFKGSNKVEISRFKGLGEMPWRQLKETTMDPENRVLLRVALPDRLQNLVEGEEVSQADILNEMSVFIDDLMGRKPEKRLAFIQQNAKFAQELDI